MKRCTKCLVEKLESEFFFKVKKTGKLQAQCKLCYKEHRKTYQAEHYRKFGDQYRARAKISRLATKRKLRTRMVDYLRGKSCLLCGEDDIRVLEFDHLDQTTKSFTIAWALGRGKSWQTIEAEIAKCRILCANCHRKHTATQNGSYRLKLMS